MVSAKGPKTGGRLRRNEGARDPPLDPSGLLSPIDKKILAILLNPDGRITTYDLAKRIGESPSTVQRRRLYLEKRFLDLQYSLKLRELGFRRVELLIATHGGQTDDVAEGLLKLDPVVYVGLSVGQQTIDVRAEVVIKDNSELLDLLELVKGFEGVKDVMWSEVVKVAGRKKDVPESIINRL